MRTNIDIVDKLMRDAMVVSDLKSKKAVVNFALSELIRASKRKSILKYRGKLCWEGNLDKMRGL